MCYCSCLPRTQHDDYNATTTKSSSNKPFLDKTMYSPITSLSNKISKQRLEQDLEVKTVNSTMKIHTILSSKAPLERNESTTVTAIYGSSNPNISMNEIRFGTRAKEREEKEKIEGTKFKERLEKEEWKTMEEEEEPMLSPIQAETNQATREEEKHEEDMGEMELKNTTKKEKWKTVEGERPMRSSSIQEKTDQETREEGKHEEGTEDLEFKKMLEKEWKAVQDESSISSAAQLGEVDPDQLASADWQPDASFLPFVSRKIEQITRATVEEGKQEKETQGSEVEGEESMSSSIQAERIQLTHTTDEEGKHEEKTEDSEFEKLLVKEGKISPDQLTSADWQPDVEEGKQEEETQGSEVEGEESMSSSIQAERNQVTHVTEEEGKHEEKTEDSEFEKLLVKEGKTSPDQLTSADWQPDVEEGKQEEETQGSEVEGEESMSSSIQAERIQVTHATDEEEKHEEKTEDSEFETLLVKERKTSSDQLTSADWQPDAEERKQEEETQGSEVEGEGSMSSSIQAEKIQLAHATDEEGKHEEETEDLEFKKLLVKERNTTSDQLASADWQSDASFLPFVSRKIEQITRATVEEGKQEEETKGSEVEREESMSSSIQAERNQVTHVTEEEGKHEEKTEDSEFEKLLVKEGKTSPDQLTSADWQPDVEEGKQEEETQDSEVEGEGSISSSIQERIQLTHATDEEGKHEEETEDLEFKKLLVKERNTTSDQLASADWQPDASFLPFVLMKTDQIARAAIEKKKHEEKKVDSEFKMLEGERRIAQEEEPMSYFVQEETGHVINGTIEEEKHEDKIDLFRNILQKKELRAERDEDISMSSFTGAQQADISLSTSTNSKLNALFSPFQTMKAGEIMHGSATSTASVADLTKMASIKMIHEVPMVKQSKMGRDRRYGTEELISASEIAAKKMKFERKRLDIKKTDSNDIYIRNHLLPTVPIIMQLPPWNSELQTTNYSSLPFETVDKVIEETFEDMNKTREESMNKSRNDTRNVIMLSDSKMNFMKTDRNLPSDGVKPKVFGIEGAKSRSTINVPFEIKQTVHVSENDHNHDANKILGEALTATIVATKSPERKKAAIKVYWSESIEKETISNDSMGELESDGKIFKNDHTILKGDEVVENNRQKLVLIKDTEMISIRSKSDSGSHFINHSELIHERQQATYFNPEETGATNITAASAEDTSAQSNISATFSDRNYSIDAPRRIPIKKINKFCLQLPIAQQAENLFKNRKFNFFSQGPQIHHSHAKNISVSNTIVFDPLEKRKTERGETLLMKIKNRIYGEEEGKEKMESRKEEEKEEEIMGSIGLQEEKARLEEARLLREEQMELRKHQQLYHGFADKAHLERYEQITQQLHLLAESERQHREQLERKDRRRLARTKHNRVAPTGDSFSTIPTSITTLSEFNNQRNEGKLLTAAQCSLIRKFVRVFNIANPVEWIRVNCPIARIYFPESSCEHMQKLFESCFQ